MIGRKTLTNGKSKRKPVDMRKVYMALDSGRSVADVAAEFGVSPSTLYRRHREYQIELKEKEQIFMGDLHPFRLIWKTGRMSGHYCWKRMWKGSTSYKIRRRIEMKRLTEVLQIRVSPEEKEHLKRCCHSSGVKFRNGKENLSAYVREKLLLESGYRNQRMEQNLRDIEYELGKIKVNCIQVEKQVEKGFGTSHDLEELREYRQRMEQAFSRLRDSL